MACSIASVIAMAGDKVIMPKASMLMIHNAWSCACGNAEELRKAADDLDVMSETLAQAYLAKSGGILAYDELKALMDKETIMPATQAHEYGLCDVVEDDTSAEDKAKAAVRNAMNSAMAMAMNRAHMMPETHDEAEETAEEKTENAESTVAENAQVMAERAIELGNDIELLNNNVSKLFFIKLTIITNNIIIANNILSI